MASLETRSGPRGASYRLVFRLGGRKYSQTLDVDSEDDANSIQASAERTLGLIAEGHKQIPAGADVGLFVVTDGRVTHEQTADSAQPLGDLYDNYVSSTPEGHLAETTLRTMRIHLKHAARILGSRTGLGSLTFDSLQGYVNCRLREKNRKGEKINPVTVRKEIKTLSGMWSWAASHSNVSGTFPGRKLKYPPTAEPQRFQTWREIEQQIKKGAGDKLWDCLFLSTTEIDELVKHAEEYAHKPYIYPMLLTAAHTGVRRSELIRSQAEDIDFKAKLITIRERKRERGHHGTRSVPMSSLLAKTLKKWLAGRKTGPTFQWKEGLSLTVDDAHTHLELTLADSKWSKLKGWHVLRHSFASNCAARGLDQRIIDAWMGHMTEAMVRRYRHHFPEQHQKALQSVFG